jgi:hypothetical protein
MTHFLVTQTFFLGIVNHVKIYFKEPTMKTRNLILSFTIAALFALPVGATTHEPHNCVTHCAQHKDKNAKMCTDHCKVDPVAGDHNCATHCAAQASDKDKACATHCAK